jgi:hypothetical protein
MTKFAVLVSFLAAPLATAVPPSVATAWALSGQATVHPGA